jgi:ATP-dependent RNA helicase RhlE
VKEPLPERFDDLGLIEPIARAVREEGYERPTPIQARAIPHLLQGRDLLGLAQTGTGKTAAFALPILQRLVTPTPPALRGPRPIRVLILTPTRELASQIADSFDTYGKHLHVRTVVIFGGVGMEPQKQACAPAWTCWWRRRVACSTWPARASAPAAPRGLRPRRGRPHARHGLHP